jgi:hypothetical protein
VSSYGVSAVPLLPPPPRPPTPQISERNCFAAIVYMGPQLHPHGASAGTRAWLRLAGDRLASPCRVDQAGVFEQLHLNILDRLGEQDRLDWSRASVDSASVRALTVVC